MGWDDNNRLHCKTHAGNLGKDDVMSTVLFSSVASPTVPLSLVSPFDAAAAPGRAVILTAKSCDAAAHETANKLVEEFVRLATSLREHDRSVAAFFLNEITCVIEARRKVQTEVCPRPQLLPAGHARLRFGGQCLSSQRQRDVLLSLG